MIHNPPKERIYTPPFKIQLVSGDNNKQCDVFPCGSIHTVIQDQEGNIRLSDKVRFLPGGYPYREVATGEQTKCCPKCQRDYPTEWPFVEPYTKEDKEGMCIRCYERKYVPHTNYKEDTYRKALRTELLLEMAISKKENGIPDEADIIKALDLAIAELIANYKKLGFKGSNVLEFVRRTQSLLIIEQSKSTISI